MMLLADPGALPHVLREPPWARGARAPEPPRLELPPLTGAARLLRPCVPTAAAEQLSWLWNSAPMSLPAQEEFLDRLGVHPAARPRLRAGEPLRAEDFADGAPSHAPDLSDLLRLPDAMALSLWNGVPAWAGGWEYTLLALLARHGEAAAPALVAYAAKRPVQGLRVGRWLDTPGLAAVALGARRRLKIAGPVAVDWLLGHPATAAQVLLRQLFGNDDAAREDARSALHAPALQALHPALLEAAQSCGAAAVEGLRAQLDADPLLHLPDRMPRLPAFFKPAALHRPRLAGGAAALPDDAMQHLGLMLAISKPGQPYAGLDAVRAACDADSLAEFAWTLFEAWSAADAPSASAWCYASLALFGNDTTAHRLGVRALQMAREGAKNHAQAAIDMLADFGSDAALMHLHNLAERCKAEVVRRRAATKVDAIALERGLSRAELADRLVPTLGLDEDRTLDFGPRRFEIAFDEALVPHVLDAQRVRLKDLPKPRLSDDAVKAGAASLRWKQLKAEMKSVARVQVVRLEQAMVEQRRWAADDFRRFFVDHPLMRELAARLVWAVCDVEGRIADAFRVAEDGTLADAQDRAYQAPADARIAIAHPLQLSPEPAAAFRLQFADYELLQPFPQLAREVYTLTDAERAATRIERFVAQECATGAVIGLLERGWRRGLPGDGGHIDRFLRPAGARGLCAALHFDPGMPVTRLSEFPRQTLGHLDLQDAEGRAVAFGNLDRVVCSEMLRDLHRLTPTLRTP